MQHIKDIITAEQVRQGNSVNSKKKALEVLAQLLATEAGSLTANEIFDSLLAREKLGSTSLGSGVALPHGRQKNLQQEIGACIVLDRGIDYDAIDNQPVDILFALLVPEESTDEHLQLLASLAEMFNNEGFRRSLREAGSPGEIHRLLASE